MIDFVLAMVSIVYALVCLTKESDPKRCSTSKLAEDFFKKGAEDEIETVSPIEQKKLNLNH